MTDKSEVALYKSVMVVDDSKIDLYVSEMVIKTYKLAEKVVLMNSAMKALDYLESAAQAGEQLPQLIFLDIRMPEVDGFGFLERYERFPENIKNQSGIIMLSSSLDKSDHDRAAGNSHVKKFLNKPLNVDKVKELLAGETGAALPHDTAISYQQQTNPQQPVLHVSASSPDRR